MEAEYIDVAKAAMKAIWIRKFNYGLGVVPSINRPMDMYCDNTGAITIADEPGVQRGYAISASLDDSLTATSARPSLKILHADLSPPPKRIRDSNSLIDLEVSLEDCYEPYVPREVGLGVDFKDNYEPYTEPDIDSNI
ncbi:hypothetical protein Tco_1179319 [Tanacetum coccineum]